MCSPRSRPIAPIIVAEFEATERPSMRTFQTLPAGKIGQAGAPARVGDASRGPVGWLAALRGSVPALTSVPSR